MRRIFPPTTRRGSVLIVVLWACLGLVSLVLLFGHSTALAYRGADNDLAGHQAEQAIDGAVRYAETLLAAATTPGALPDATSYFSEELAVGDATAWFIGRAPDDATGSVRHFGLVDEASKLNLNAASQEMLMKLPLGMSQEFADAIVEWRTPAGSSTGSSSGGITATTIKHADFESVEELALVAGATREILYGEDTNRNGVLDANEDDGDKSDPPDNSDGKLDPGLLEYVTVFGTEATKQSDGTTDRVSITDNAGMQSVIAAANFDAARLPQIQAALRPPAVKSVLEFVIRSEMTDAEFEQIAGKIMFGTPSAPVAGLINVNTAGEAVLACIAGLEGKAATIVAVRAKIGELGIGIAWFKEALNDNTLLAAVAPLLTTQSFQVDVDVAAVGRKGRGYRRARSVVDLTTGTPRIIYRRDLSALGWALGSDVRQTLALRKETQ